MRTTSGRAAVRVELRDRVERLLSPAGVCDDLEVGLAVEECVQAAADDLVVVHDQHSDDRVRLHDRSLRPGRPMTDTHDRSPAGNAPDGQRGARLRGARPHGFEAIVAGVIRLGVEAGAVVADLQRDGVATRLDVDPGPLGRRMLDDVRERLPADGEELRFDSRAQGQALLGPADGDGEPLRVPEGGGVAREAGHEALVLARAVQLGEKDAHLPLSACGQFRDRVQGAGDRPVGVEPLLLEIPLGGARMQERSRRAPARPNREGRVRCGGAPRSRPVSLPLLRLGERRDRALPLADEGADEQRRQRSHGDVELGAQRLVVDRLPEEWAKLVRREPDRGAGCERDREGCPGGPKRSAAQISAGKTR